MVFSVSSPSALFLSLINVFMMVSSVFVEIGLRVL